MIQEFCQNCGRVTGHKRALGVGTFLGACMTLGVSLTATPFYPKRCVVCGCKREITWKAAPTKTFEQIYQENKERRERCLNAIMSNLWVKSFHNFTCKIIGREDLKR